MEALDAAAIRGDLIRCVSRPVTVDLHGGVREDRGHGGTRDRTGRHQQADARALPFEDGVFDLATSQFGLMFLEDPTVGVREMARVARRGMIAVWDGIGGSEFTTVMGTGRSDSIDQWVTTEVRGRTLGDDVSAERLQQLIEAARRRLASFLTDEGCVFGMGARVVSWVA